MTEDELLRAIAKALTRCGWRWFHVRRSDKAIVQGSQGWPDIFAVRGSRAMALELKAHRGVLTAEQAAWIAALKDAGVEGMVVYPAMLDAVLGYITAA